MLINMYVCCVGLGMGRRGRLFWWGGSMWRGHYVLWRGHCVSTLVHAKGIPSQKALAGTLAHLGRGSVTLPAAFNGDGPLVNKLPFNTEPESSWKCYRHTWRFYRDTWSWAVGDPTITHWRRGKLHFPGGVAEATNRRRRVWTAWYERCGRTGRTQ